MRTCQICGNQLLPRHKKFCSKKCYGQYLHDNPDKRNGFKPGIVPWNKGMKGYHAGPKHWHWKGGKRKHTEGYVETYNPAHLAANSGGYVLEHRLVMEKHLGRLLTEDEVVHHIDGNVLNNDISNLTIMSNAEHSRLHTTRIWGQRREDSL